jgi:hypothetical protein
MCLCAYVPMCLCAYVPMCCTRGSVTSLVEVYPAFTSALFTEVREKLEFYEVRSLSSGF